MIASALKHAVYLAEGVVELLPWFVPVLEHHRSVLSEQRSVQLFKGHPVLQYRLIDCVTNIAAVFAQLKAELDCELISKRIFVIAVDLTSSWKDASNFWIRIRSESLSIQFTSWFLLGTA